MPDPVTMMKTGSSAMFRLIWIKDNYRGKQQIEKRVAPSRTSESGTNRKGAQGKEASEAKTLVEKVIKQDYRWVIPLAHLVHNNAPVLAYYLAAILSSIASHPLDFHAEDSLHWQMTRSLASLLFPKSGPAFEKVEHSLEHLGVAFSEISSELLHDPATTSQIIEPAIRYLAHAIEINPHLIVLLGHPDILSEGFGKFGEQISGVLALFPALSTRAAAHLPNLKEVFFNAIFELSEDERARLYALSETILREVYQSQVFPRLQEILSSDPSGKVLTPLLSGVIEVIPGESCLNACISIACTPRDLLNTGRVIALAIQELGGLYVKISQVIAEVCPPSLARELRTSQDDAGGLFPSTEKSWNFLLAELEHGDLKEWKTLFKLPSTPQPHFASASLGALYELELSAAGQQRYKAKTVLVKLQRPGLEDLLARQCDHLLKLCDEASFVIAQDVELTADLRGELSGIALAIRRAVLNYFKQSTTELDFTQEQHNAERVRAALRPDTPIRIPKYFHTSQKTVVMERMAGTKVTKIVQSKYLERREIADSIASAYLELVFEQGVVWADPHPGNILFDDITDQVSMIDLNPCFVWDKKNPRPF